MTLSTQAQKVKEALDVRGVACEVIEMPASTRTAQGAADAIGCRVRGIAKSLVFREQQTGRPLLVIASGTHRVDEARLALLAGEPVARADIDFVRRSTGFALGGVPPVGHTMPLPTWIDEDLLQYDRVWATAGTSHAVFALSPADLPKITGGIVTTIACARDTA